MSSGSTSPSLPNRPRDIPVYKRLDHEYDINESHVDVPRKLTTAFGHAIQDLYVDGINLELGPYVGPMANVAVSQTSDGTLDPYNHPEGPSLSDVNQPRSSQIGTTETYDGEPPSVGAMTKVVVSQTSDGVDRYNHPEGPSLSDMNQPRSSQIGTSETYGGGQPPSVGAMTKVVVSQTSDGVDPYNHPEGPSLSDMNQPRSSQIGTSETYGGGRRCQREGCRKGAKGKTVFCKAHGGGRRCEFLGCTKSAEGRTDYCIGHGGGRRCSHDGCTHAARGKSGLCIRHGGGKRCKMEGCYKSAEGVSSLCISHGGGRRCQYPACTKGAQGSTMFCKAHGGGKMSSGSSSPSFPNRPRYIPVYKRLDHEYDINESRVDVPRKLTTAFGHATQYLYVDGINLILGPYVGAMANVAVSQTSVGSVDPYNHPEGPSLSDVNQPRSSQIGISETYGGGQPPSVGAMAKVVVSQTSDGVDPYNHPGGPSLSNVNQPRWSQIGTSETYGGGQPPSVGAMAKVVVSQSSDGTVDPDNHPKGPSHSDVNKQGSSQNGISDQDIVMLDAPGALKLVGVSLVGPKGNSHNHFENESTVDVIRMLTKSVGAMSEVAVSQTSDDVDLFNHPKGTSLISDVNQRNSSQNGTSNQDIVMLDAPGAQELVGMSF